jgi:hypothetical protein
MEVAVRLYRFEFQKVKEERSVFRSTPDNPQYMHTWDDKTVRLVLAKDLDTAMLLVSDELPQKLYRKLSDTEGAAKFVAERKRKYPFSYLQVQVLEEIIQGSMWDGTDYYSQEEDITEKADALLDSLVGTSKR